MANKQLFQSATRSTSKMAPAPDMVNQAGGVAYSLSDAEALSQLVMTGTFNQTFYASGEDQLKTVLELAQKVKPEFLAKLAVHARMSGYMKDSPALLVAILATKDGGLFKKVFSRVIDNGKMLRNFVQIMRSGTVGRKSLGTMSKRAIQAWLESRTDSQLFHDSVGNDPSLADVIKMVHPRPQTDERKRMFAYLIDKFNPEWTLPEAVKAFEEFKAAGKDHVRQVPKNVSFQMLTALDLADDEWVEIAKNMKWQATRMNLNTMIRHNVFKKSSMVDLIANRLKSEQEVIGAKAFPYQLMTAYMNADSALPSEVRNALQDALEISTRNVPSFGKKVHVLVDVSGSMSSSATGGRGSATSVVTCVDVAALIASCVLRANENAKVYQFDTSARGLNLNPRDSIVTNTKKIKAHGGGTDCASAIRLLNSSKETGDLVIMVSDNQSWFNGENYYGSGTGVMEEWLKFKTRNKNAKLVCIDIQPYAHAQAKTSPDILNIGGFSDEIWNTISSFASGGGSSTYWVDTIEKSVKL